VVAIAITKVRVRRVRVHASNAPQLDTLSKTLGELMTETLPALGADLALSDDQ